MTLVYLPKYGGGEDAIGDGNVLFVDSNSNPNGPTVIQESGQLVVDPTLSDFDTTVAALGLTAYVFDKVGGGQVAVRPAQVDKVAVAGGGATCTVTASGAAATTKSINDTQSNVVTALNA